jgi:lipopolysaccharide export system permease protein
MAIMGYASRLFSPSVYTNRLMVWSILELCLLVLLLEGLYLSERLIHILEMVIDQPGGALKILPLLLWTAPEVHIALPIVVLIAVYRVILRCREQREFMVLASSGQGISALLGTATCVALIAFLLSQIISGLLFPLAKFAFRSDVFQNRYQAMRAGSTSGQFIYFPNYTIYVWPTVAGEANHAVFVKEIVDAENIRIINADRMELLDGPKPDRLAVRMLGVSVNDFPNLNEARVGPENAARFDSRDGGCSGCKGKVNSTRTVSLVKELDLDNLASLDGRGLTLDEWTTPELLGLVEPPNGRAWRADGLAESLRRFARSLLCVIAPFFGWLTLTFTNRRSQAFALPVVCAIVMCGDIIFTQLIANFAAGRTIITAALLIATTVGFISSLVWLILEREHLVVSPAMARS